MIKFIISQFYDLKSASFIARENNISVSTVLRFLDKISVHKPVFNHITVGSFLLLYIKF